MSKGSCSYEKNHVLKIFMIQLRGYGHNGGNSEKSPALFLLFLISNLKTLRLFSHYAIHSALEVLKQFSYLSLRETGTVGMLHCAHEAGGRAHVGEEGACKCAYLCVQARVQCCLPQSLSTLFFDTVSPQNWEPPYSLRRTSQQIKGLFWPLH